MSCFSRKMAFSSRPSQSSGSSNRSRQSARIVAQTTVDAKLDAEFDELGTSFDYTRSVSARAEEPPASSSSSLPGGRPNPVTTAYLQQIQRGRLIQPFGCLLAIDERTFRVLAFSENAPEMLTLANHAVPSVGAAPLLGAGTDVRSLFTAPSTAALQKALGFADVSLLNPVLVHCRTSGKPFYAILHRVTGCLVVDLEPVNPSDMPMTAACALQSYKLASKAIARLQSLPGGSVERLCGAVVEEVFELTGYDRVMAYRFHEDDHGEVVAEATRPGLEPYLGLHYPATDIPQAARFLFMKNKVRIICDCHAKPVRIRQDDRLPHDITFCGSTLRAPHSCHLQYMANMNSIASLVMAVVVNEGGDEDDNEDNAANAQSSQHSHSSQSSQSQKRRKRLWGLVVCHHESPRFVPFPLRYACEFLAQVFAIHVNNEFELENQMREKSILRMQTLLCDVLLREAGPLGIVTQSPNIMDLLKCDGAALLYRNAVWKLGATPTDSQIADIAYWLRECHGDSTGLSTDSLHEAGYPGARAVSEVVCGMAAARITCDDILFWFRSPTSKDVRWGGAKHDPADRDDGKRMHPRSSFRAFLEVVKMRSPPWFDYEMDAIHSLQLILRGNFHEEEEGGGGGKKSITALESRMNDIRVDGMVKLQAVTNEMVRLIETASVPILAVDADGLVNGWNLKIAELTGLPVEQAIGKHLLALVEDCSADAVRNMLLLALQGREEKNVEFQMRTHGPRRDDDPVILIVNACASRDINENVVGVCFVAQDMTVQKSMMDKFTRMEGDYKGIVLSPNPLIPPIFGADEFGWCSEWNPAMAKLSGWRREEVVDKMLLGEVFGTNMACCKVINQDAFVNLSIVINNAMTGQETEKTQFRFVNRNGRCVECLLSVSKKVDRDDVVTGIFCFLHIPSHELQKVIKVQQLSQETATKGLKALGYLRHAIRNPLSGVMYSKKMLKGTDLDDEQKRLLRISANCQLQMNRVLDDFDLDNITESSLELEMVEFVLQDVMVAAVSQVMIASTGKGIRMVYDISLGFMSEGMYGDNLRLQQILADFLMVSVKSSPRGGQVEITTSLKKDRLGQDLHLIRLEIRILHTGSGVSEELLSQMYGNSGDPSEEGISLLVSRKLLRLMNGDVHYLREAGKSAFILSVELASSLEPQSTRNSV